MARECTDGVAPGAAVYSPIRVHTGASVADRRARPAATVALLPGRAAARSRAAASAAGLPAAPGRRAWRSPGGMTVFPGGGVDAGDRPDPACGAGPARSGGRGGSGARPDEAGALVSRRCARRSRSAACCWPDPAAPTVDPDAARDDLVARRRTLGDVLARGRPGAARRPAAPVGPLDHPGGRAAALRHRVLRRRACRTGRRPTRTPPRRSRPPGGTRTRRWTARERGELQLMAPTLHTLQEIAAHAGQSPPCSPRRGAPGDPAVHRPVVAPRRPTRGRHGAPGDPDVGGSTSRARPTRDRIPPTASCARSPPLASVLLADNPSPMTLEGTNTWVLRAPGEEACVVVDPGEDDAGAPGAGGRAAARSRWSCSPTATTTTPAGARRFAELTGRPGAGAGPVAGARFGGARRRRRGRRRGRRAAGARHPGPHVGLAVVPARRARTRIRPCSPATPSSAAAPP